MSLFSKLFGSKRLAEAPIFEAILADDEHRVRALIAQGADVNSMSVNGDPAIVIASVQGKQMALQGLIAEGADVDRPSTLGLRALNAAVQYGHENIVMKLIAAGADVNIPFNNPQMPLPVFPLTLAFRKKNINIVRYLLEAGANPNTLIVLPGDPPEAQGTTAVIYSASANDLEMLRLFLQHGADPNAFKADGITALMAATMNGHFDAVVALVESRANINLYHALDPEATFSAVDVAQKTGQTQIAEFLLSRGAIPWPGNQEE